MPKFIIKIYALFYQAMPIIASPLMNRIPHKKKETASLQLQKQTVNGAI